MSDTTASLLRRIKSGADLQSVVRAMKAIAGSRIAQYETAVRALADYANTVDLGLGACLRESQSTPIGVAPIGVAPRRVAPGPGDASVIGAVVFGSDQGLVGQFNQVLADHACATLAALPGKAQVWAVGGRVRARLAEAGLALQTALEVPSSVQAIAPLVGQIQVESDALRRGGDARFYVFHNRPLSQTLYEPVAQRLLPFDAQWRTDRAAVGWPNKNLPAVMGAESTTLRALIGEYVFISLFRACAESLASENASRLAAMERADKNIDELLESDRATFHRLRQDAIDEELFDVISGYEALAAPRQRWRTNPLE